MARRMSDEERKSLRSLLQGVTWGHFDMSRENDEILNIRDMGDNIRVVKGKRFRAICGTMIGCPNWVLAIIYKNTIIAMRRTDAVFDSDDADHKRRFRLTTDAKAEARMRYGSCEGFDVAKDTRIIPHDEHD